MSEYLFGNRSMNNTASMNNGSSSSSLTNQILYGMGFVLGLYVILFSLEVIYMYLNRLHMNRTELLPYTYVTDNKAITIAQNPNVKRSKPISLSDNERTGIEFSYSFYLYVHPSTFREHAGLLHLFHKGYANPFPLMAPGVFMHAHTNTLRVYMNTFKGWNQFADIQNIPVNKWVHMVVLCKSKALEVYVNGNLSRKMSFDGYAPYQNYQDIHAFSQRSFTLRKATIPSLGDADMEIVGAMKGMMSRLTYFNYALTYSEIHQLMNEGPSTTMDGDMMNDIPPYLADNWWTQTAA